MLELPAPERAAPAAAGAQTVAPAAPAGAPRRTLVVMQPTFLPWAGYFNLMAQADDFVFLDDVQLEKQSWQTRNRLAFGGQALWLPVPVRHTHLAQTIAETEVLHASRWRDKLARGFAQNYARHPHLADAREVLDTLLAQPAEARLAALNEAVIRHIADRLGLRPRLHRASALGVAGLRSDRLIGLCAALGATEYLSPRGSADYLAEDGFAARAPATLRLQDFQPRPYRQQGLREHLPFLSVVDVVANLGWQGARSFVLTGTAP